MHILSLCLTFLKHLYDFQIVARHVFLQLIVIIVREIIIRIST